MALTEQQRIEVWRDFMCHPDLGLGRPLGVFGDVTKHGIRAIVDAIADGKRPPEGLTPDQQAKLAEMVDHKESPPVIVKPIDPRIENTRKVLAEEMGIGKDGVAEKLLAAMGVN